MLHHPCILGGPQQREQNRKSKPTPGVTMMHHVTKRGFKDCPKCAPLAHPLKGHRWGTGPKRCPARARRANVPPWSAFVRVYATVTLQLEAMIETLRCMGGTARCKTAMAKQPTICDHQYQSQKQMGLTPDCDNTFGDVSRITLSPPTQAIPSELGVSGGVFAQHAHSADTARAQRQLLRCLSREHP